MEVSKTSIPGVLLLKPKVFHDTRGYFLEAFNERVYREIGVPYHFVQDNFSRSAKHTLRGIHLQRPFAQGKIVRVARGQAYDVAVDLRKDSPTFGHHFGTILDDQKCCQLLIPPGCGHGFLALSEIVDFEYKCTDFYHSEAEVTVMWNDPDLNIQWPEVDDVIISDKDRKGISFSRFCEL